MKPDWQALRAGEVRIGSFLSTGYPVNAEIVGRAGFDFVVIDLEHGMGSEREVLTQLQVLEATPAQAVVRVESHQAQRVHRILDLGAHGIMFPRVSTADQARACVTAMRYPPDGVRGVAVLVRASGYGREFTEYRDTSKTALLTILQIETAEAVENVEQIAEVEGVDVLFIGPMDLSTSLGTFRQYDHPKFVEAVNRTVDAARRNGRVLGILLGNPDDYRKYFEWGFRLILCGTDTSFLQNAARATAEAMRKAI